MKVGAPCGFDWALIEFVIQLVIDNCTAQSYYTGHFSVRMQMRCKSWLPNELTIGVIIGFQSEFETNGERSIDCDTIDTTYFPSNREKKIFIFVLFDERPQKCDIR